MNNPTNTAAYLPVLKAPRLEIKSAPYTLPKKCEIVIKNKAVAVNPLDYLLQDMGGMIFAWIKYPSVIGEDVAGEVVEIGPGVTRFTVGDRVVGFATGLEKDDNVSAMCAFQQYTVLHEHLTSPIPDNMSYESASVLPLGLSTAACGLFEKNQLAMQYPTMSSKTTPTGKTLLVWGGSSSVGSNAIQLAVAAGYEVFTTASPQNFDYVKGLGASKVFDYRSRTVVSDLIRAFEGRTTAGAISIGNNGADCCMDVIDKCQGNKFVAMASYPNPDPMPTSLVMPRFILHYITWSIATWIKSKRRGIGYKFIWGGNVLQNEVGPVIFVNFLPDALAAGTFVAAPAAMVVGKGLEQIQTAVDLLKKGVSAKKLVITL